MSILERERISGDNNVCALYLYFLSLRFRYTSKAIQPLFEEKGRSHVAIWKWVQRFNPKHVYCYKRMPAFLIDENMVTDWL